MAAPKQVGGIGTPIFPGGTPGFYLPGGPGYPGSYGTPTGSPGVAAAGFGGFGGYSPLGVPVFLDFGGTMPTRLIVPPGGFAGLAQQSPATQLMFARAGRRGGKRSARRRRARARAAGAPRRRARRARGRRARLVKGSAAARRYMAKLRRMRKRR